MCSKPIKMWIDGACFKIKEFHKIKKPKLALHSNKEEECTAAAEDDHKFILTKTASDTFSTSFQLPSIYYIRLNAFKDFSLDELKLQTHTNITIPKNGSDGHIQIVGNSESDVIDARQQMHSVIGAIREHLSPTQFIQIPVNSEEIKRNFEQFKKEILTGDPIPGVEESIFQSPIKLHLTIAVSVLLSDSEKEEAIAALNTCKSEIIEPFLFTKGHLKIKVTGIDCMNDNFSKVNVLYAKAKVDSEDEDVLQKLADSISDYFYDRGLVVQYKNNVKLHVTLMNTRYRHSSTQSSPTKSRWYARRQSFDARGILKTYKDFYFGESSLNSVHLSYMSLKDEDGFYKPLSMVTL
ncbi:hypothetical protein FQA39_LY09297 [Lamprigera yunnana]|nr:hypothetical protein FQA39_LY09297 [Lamprigera yunnana]